MTDYADPGVGPQRTGGGTPREASPAGAPNGGLREVMVGRIGRPHGLRGHLVIDVRTDEPEVRFTPGAVLRTEAGPSASPEALRVSQLTVESARWHQERLLLTFAEVPDRTAAERIRGLLLFVDVPADAVPEDPEEFYDHQLLGLAVVDEAGATLGTLTRVQHGAAQDLLVVTTTDGRDALVPFVKALVPQVDLAAGHIVVADRPGLIAPFAED